MATDRATVIYDAKDQTRGASESVRRNLLDVQRQVKSTSEQLSQFSDIFQRVFVASVAARFFQEIVGRTIEAERAFNQLKATLTATGHAAGQTTADIQALVQEISGKTVFDDDEIQAAANALLRFRDIQGETFREALKLAPAVATVLGEDLRSAATRIGRALEDPKTGLRGLREIFGDLKQSQKDAIDQFLKFGDVAAAQKVIIDAMKGSLGGIAEGENQGLYGSVKSVSKAWDDMLKTIGSTGVVQAVVTETFGYITQAIKDFQEDINNFKKANSIGEFFKALLNALDPDRENRPVPQVVEPTDSAELEKRRAERRKAEEGERIQRDRQIAEAARQRQAQADKDARTLLKAETDTRLEAVRQYASQEQQIWDIMYERGHASVEEYYDKRLEITQRGLNAEIAAVQRAIAIQLDVRSRAKDEDKAGINADILRLQAQRDRLQQQADFAASLTHEQRANANVRMGDSAAEIQAALAEQRGLLAEAAELRFDIQNRVLRANLVSNFGSDSDFVRQLDRLRQLTIANATFNQLQEDAGRLRDDEAQQEERIQNSRRVGAINDLQALKMTDDARRGQLADLARVEAAMQGIADASGDPKQIAAVKQLRAQIQELAASAGLLGDKFRTVFADNFTSGLDDFVLGLKTASEAFRSFAQGVIRELIHIANQQIAMAIFGRGGIAGGIGDALAGIFGGAVGAGGSTRNPKGFAGGGTYGPSDVFWVGEHGPELMLSGPNSSGRIVPADQIGGGATNITINVAAGGGSAGPIDNTKAALVARMIADGAYAVLVREKRPGGLLAATAAR